VDSREGYGSTFWFTAVFGLRDVQQAAAAPHADPFGSAGPGTDRKSGARILIAEDNVTNQVVSLAQLKKLGYLADAVGNGEEAVKAVQSGRYDLVLMDCQMPVMDGFEATRQIRVSSLPRIPIVAVTADALPADRDRCLNAGMDDYLAKPVQMSQLANTLSKWLAAPGAADAAPATSEAPLVAAGDPESERSKEVFNAESLLQRLMGDKQIAAIVLKGCLRRPKPDRKHSPAPEYRRRAGYPHAGAHSEGGRGHRCRGSASLGCARNRTCGRYRAVGSVPGTASQGD